jgi:hypothetical protein
MISVGGFTDWLFILTVLSFKHSELNMVESRRRQWLREGANECDRCGALFVCATIDDGEYCSDSCRQHELIKDQHKEDTDD